MAADTPNALVKFSKIAYSDLAGNNQVARMGDEISVSDDELARLVGLNAVENLSVKLVSKMSGEELDAKAAELEIDAWDPDAKVADKKSAIQAHLDGQE